MIDTRLCFDLGPGRNIVPAHWNQLSEPRETGVVLRHAMDVRGRTTSVSVWQVDDWSGFNTHGAEVNGTRPRKATGDSFYVGDSGNRSARIRLVGLTPGSRYAVTLFASLMKGQRKHSGVYTVGTERRTFDAMDNTATELKFPAVDADANGKIVITVECAEDTGWAYLNFVEVAGVFAEADVWREPAESLDDPPVVSCKAWAIADGRTGKILWQHNARRKLAMASTTKLMTALVVGTLAEADSTVLEEMVLISKKSDATIGSSANVREGERVKVGELLYGLLLPSGNDASVALAEHFNEQLKTDSAPPAEAHGPHSSYRHFIARMNATAQRLGMEKTHYINPHGLDAIGHHTTASDMLRLARAALGSPVLAKRVSTREFLGQMTTPDGGTRPARWRNTNRLLGITGYDGMKTGTTSQAGACLVSSSRRGKDRLLMVVLGATSSTGRYVDSRNLYRWAWRKLGHR